MKPRILLVLLITAQFFFGCASAPDEATATRAAIAEGAKVFERKDFDLVWIPSSGAIADATFIVMSAKEPSLMARDLATQISAAKKSPVNLVIAGPNSSKAKRVLLDALSLAGGELPHLRVLFLGTASDSDEAAAALRRIGAAPLARARS